MNAAALTTALLALIAVWSAGATVIFTAKARAQRLRGLYGRLCVQLAPDQRILWPDTRYADFANRVRDDADLLTALDFVDHPDTGESVLEHIGAVSPSLFVFPIARLAILGNVTALVFGTGFVVIFCLLFADSARSLSSTDLGLGLVIGMAAAAGVAFSLTMSLIVWRIYFERDVTSTIEFIERHALWSTGLIRRPENRKLIDPDDDSAFSKLAK